MSDDESLRALQRQLAKLSDDLNRMAGAAPVILFKDYADKYTVAKLARPKLRESTKTSFENQVRKHLIPWFGMLPLDKITNALWVERISEEKSLKKFFNSRKALVEILRAAQEEGNITKLPTFDNPDEYEPVGRVVEDAEVIRLLRKATRPFRFIFYVFWRMGCRPREILQWEWTMFTFSEPGKTWARIPDRISKTGRTRQIAIDPKVSRYLHIRHSRGNGSPFVFPRRTDPSKPQLSYQSAVVTAARKAGVTDFMVYDFRRTLITKWCAAGKSQAFIARQLDTSETMIRRFYLKDDVEAMEGLFK